MSFTYTAAQWPIQGTEMVINFSLISVINIYICDNVRSDWWVEAPLVKEPENLQLYIMGHFDLSFDTIFDPSNFW